MDRLWISSQLYINWWIVRMNNNIATHMLRFHHYRSTLPILSVAGAGALTLVLLAALAPVRRPQSIRFFVEPTVVHPGQSITLNGDMHNTLLSATPNPDRPLTVLDASGTNLLRTREGVAAAAKLRAVSVGAVDTSAPTRQDGDRLRAALEQLPGFMAADDVSFIGLYGVEPQFDAGQTGCPIGLSGRHSTTPDHVAFQLVVQVLKNTPPGTYHLHVPAAWLCVLDRFDPRHDMLSPAQSFPIQVLP